MKGYNSGGGRVCVTGASGFVGSWLVMRLLERGYYVNASVRNPGDEKKVKHLLELPKAKTHLSIWKGDLTVEGSFDDAIHGCEGVFHVATHMDFLSAKNPENDIIKPTVNGVLNILRSCSKAKTVKRIIYTSTTGTVTVQSQPQVEYNESLWTDVDFCKARNFTGWCYFVAKTMAEKAAWDFAKEYDIDLVTILPSLVVGPFITPFRPSSVGLGIALFTKNEAVYPLLKQARAVHVDDVCNAHIYLFEHPRAQGRYICCSHNYTIFDLAKSLNLKYPEEKIPINFEGFDESLEVVHCSSKKLLDLGFTFTYDPIEYNVGDIVHETIECCRERGLLHS